MLKAQMNWISSNCLKGKKMGLSCGFFWRLGKKPFSPPQCITKNFKNTENVKNCT